MGATNNDADFAKLLCRVVVVRQFVPPPGPAVRCGALGGGRAIKTIVASGSRLAPETPLDQRAVERTLCSDQSAHAGGWITRGEVLICTTDE